ncbi:MAG: GGDEF domain-containing protein [Alphaproteobacteria bacterium]
MTPTVQMPGEAPAFPIRTIRLGLALMIALLVASTVLTWRVGNQIRPVMDEQVAVLMATEKVEHYGNVLELSIKAVVNHGDAQAADEYRRVQPQLRSLLTDLSAQLRSDRHEADVSEIDRSDLELIGMEYRALNLVSRGEMEAARRIIYSPRYDYLVDSYFRGIQAIERRAERYLESTRWQLNLYIWLIVGMSAASLILVILGWGILIVPTRRWGDQLDRARKDAEHSAQLLELKQTELQRLNGQLFDQVRTDALTGLGTRLKLNEDIAELWPRLERKTSTASVMICDIDHFKQYNDSFGHLAGDEVLRRVAGALDGVRRSGDQLYRLGGEEFLVILHDCGPVDAAARAEDYRKAVERLEIPHPASPLGKVTVSVGVAPMGPSTTTLQCWLNAADEAMYEAKSGGRNRVVASLKLAA